MASSSTIGPLTPTVTSLPPNKRYILTHTPTGTSTVHSSPAHLYHGRAGVGGMARSYATSSVPATLAAEADITAYLSPSGPTSHTGTDIVVPTQKGVNLVVVDIAPGGQSQMHRTVSIDFSICVIGHVRMELDGGEMLDLHPGVLESLRFPCQSVWSEFADGDIGPCDPARHDAQVVQRLSNRACALHRRHSTLRTFQDPRDGKDAS